MRAHIISKETIFTESYNEVTTASYPFSFNNGLEFRPLLSIEYVNVFCTKGKITNNKHNKQ